MNTNWNSSTEDTLFQSAPNPISILSPGGFGFEKPAQGITNDWLTHSALLKRLGTFDLDPCGCIGMPWRTASGTYFLPEHDGLQEPWRGRVFCNPPYGPHVGAWAKRMAEPNGIMLIFPRTESATWQKDILPFADATFLPEGRLHFYLPTGERGNSGTAPSALLAYGQQNADALRTAGVAGAFCPKSRDVDGNQSIAVLVCWARASRHRIP